ncbi:MAG: carotenoid biosynthesis protein [Paludibacter sp.]|nr:carotenoid biosynthesis protein [Paludibacter sp.]MDD4199155.1 carotenoid biosynthesis protein [Paludibacter sp.]MDD4427787.1 carotenoid biosynthesis protein [Paludibacter sp.]
MKSNKLTTILRNPREVRRFLVWFYIIGVTGMVIPATSALFMKLIPLALLMNFGLLLMHHEDKFSVKTILIFSLILLSGFFIEILGVQTGIIFGEYIYGKGLGWKLWDTPLIIGLNWLLLVYTTATITQKIKAHNIIRIALGAGMMLVYDVVMEQVAPRMDMWSWKDGIIPVENYIAWFVIASLFHALIQFSGIKIRNKISETVLIAQFVFFVILFILL